MSSLQIALLLLLCVITYPFVIGMEWLIRARGLKKVYAMEVTDEQYRREQRNALFGTPIHPAVIAAAVLAGALRLAPETVVNVLLTFAITFVWTEVYHYAQHRAMHLRRLHFMHKEHHRSRITNSWTSISFSFWEEFFFAVGIVGFLAMVSQFLPLSFYGIVAWYLLYFSTNTLGHANVEINAPGYHDSFFGKIFTTSAYHAMHHARYVGNYGLLTVFMDRLCGTEWADSPEVQTRAAQGHGLTALMERFDTPADAGASASATPQSRN